jgi:hypothetical protein
VGFPLRLFAALLEARRSGRWRHIRVERPAHRDVDFMCSSTL